METFHKMNGSEDPKDVFDPSRHHLVAVDKVSKLHFHVTLDEIARDAQVALSQPLPVLQSVPNVAPDVEALRLELERLSRLLLSQERAMQGLMQALDEASVMTIEDGGREISFPVKKALEIVLRHGRFLQDAEGVSYG